MITFVTFLRALAACLITNAHYTGIYPSDFIANGGLVGDVIFFAVSGFCLYHVRFPFFKWYGKRLIRVYIPAMLITAVYMILGFYMVSAEKPVLWWFVYPTYYHFVASIIVLYIPFYAVMKVDKLRNHLPIIMLGTVAAYAVVYLLVYDKSYYHIDKVREPMIRFLFMESMFLGAWFRQKDKEYRNKKCFFPLAASVLMFGVYIVSKVVFMKIESLSSFQILNQIAIFILLYFIFRLFAAIDGKLESLPHFVIKAVSFIAEITLEIYVVQYVLIDLVRPHFFFPVNWIMLTAYIILSAFILHMVCKPIIKRAGYLFEKTAAGRRGDTP